jgi:2-(1,2-epoxy-1,2-dihydrophenyl)acetyl-CoA isomerase
MSDTLLFAVEQGIATITLNRPDKRNAFNLEMIEAWTAALISCRDNDDVRVVVITGAGKAFCSGGDVGGMVDTAAETPLANKDRLWRHIHRVAFALEDIDKPVIVAVNGIAAGAGMDMALLGDIRFAAQSARFAESYVKMGLVPGDGGAYLLPRIVGTAKALELLWTGDAISADEAERLGIVNKVVPDEELMAITLQFARRLADGPSIAIGLIKRAVYQSARLDLRTSLDLVSSHMAVVKASDDHKEAARAFVEKRQPKFKGR